MFPCNGIWILTVIALPLLLLSLSSSHPNCSVTMADDRDPWRRSGWIGEDDSNRRFWRRERDAGRSSDWGARERGRPRYRESWTPAEGGHRSVGDVGNRRRSVSSSRQVTSLSASSRSGGTFRDRSVSRARSQSRPPSRSGRGLTSSPPQIRGILTTSGGHHSGRDPRGQPGRRRHPTGSPPRSSSGRNVGRRQLTWHDDFYHAPDSGRDWRAPDHRSRSGSRPAETIHRDDWGRLDDTLYRSSSDRRFPRDSRGDSPRRGDGPTGTGNARALSTPRERTLRLSAHDSAPQEDWDTEYPDPTESAPTGVSFEDPVSPRDSTEGDRQAVILREATGTIYKLLKVLHHLDAVSAFSKRGILPDGYAKKVRELSTFFLPSDPSPAVTSNLTQAAENWISACYLALEEHYSTAVVSLTGTLNRLDCPSWQDAWDSACEWAHSELKGGLIDSLVSKARSLIPSVSSMDCNDQGSECSLQPPVSQQDPAPELDTPSREPPAPVPRALFPSGVHSATISITPSLGIPPSDRITWAPLPQRPPRVRTHSTKSRISLFPVKVPAPETPLSASATPPQPHLSAVDTNDRLVSDTARSPLQTPAVHSPASASDSPSQVPVRIVSQSLPHPPAPASPPSASSPSAGPSTSPKGPSDDASFLEPSSLMVHPHGGDKSTWTIVPRSSIIIMGDSNIRNLPPIHDKGIQVDCYPGATFYHAHSIISSLPQPCPEVRKLVLSFGLNNRDRGTVQSLDRSLNHMLKAASRLFPNAEIKVPMVSFSTRLPDTIQTRLVAINDCIALVPHIPALTPSLFSTRPDNIHWTTETGCHMWNLWKRHLN